MFFKKSNSEVSGLEINSSSIRFITITLKGRSWYLSNELEIELPDNVVKPSFNKKNIQNQEIFQEILQQLRKKLKVGISCPVGLSLPSESVKLVVKSFPKLPEDEQNIKNMVLWSLGKSSMITADSVEVKWSLFKDTKGVADMPSAALSNVLVAGVASKSVLNEYVDSIQKELFIPQSVCSYDLNLFNFYASAISETGTVAWLGIFSDSISLFVFKDAVPQFYKNLRKNLISQNDADNIDMLIQYCMDENPDLTIEKYYLSAAYPPSDNRLSNTIFNAAECQWLLPSDLISINSNDQTSCCQYASAFGAAWSTLAV